MNNIIINADDFGRSHEVNDAICECMIKGYIQRTSLMVNMPGTEEAIEMSRKYHFEDKIGLHINLCEGTPLLYETQNSFLCRRGEFNSCINHRSHPSWRILFNKKEQRCIQKEVDAQIRKFLKLGYNSGHIDSHRHIHYNLGVLFSISSLLKKYEFKSIRKRNDDIGGNIFEKMIYKNIIERLELESTDYFYSLRQWEKFDNYEEIEKSSVELSVHPYTNNENEIMDSVGKLFPDGGQKCYEKYNKKI